MSNISWPGAGPHEGHIVRLLEKWDTRMGTNNQVTVGRVKCSCGEIWTPGGWPAELYDQIMGEDVDLLYPKESRWGRKDHLERRWRLDCDLAYDGGGSKWSRGYRTKLGARIAAFYHYHLGSFGGSIKLVDTKEGGETNG